MHGPQQERRAEPDAADLNSDVPWRVCIIPACTSLQIKQRLRCCLVLHNPPLHSHLLKKVIL